MTAPPAHRSPIAGLFNDLLRLLTRRYRARIAELEEAIVAATAANQRLKKAS